MRKQKGFTLIEILVVVSILGVLMGLVSVLVLRSTSHSQKTKTVQVVTTYLPNAIERYKQEFRRLPPMTIAELIKASDRWKGLAIPDNETNVCSEALLVALRHPDFTAPLGDGDLPVDEPFSNTDDDSFNKTPDGSPNADAREICDSWGNPIVYISKNHYETPVSIVNAAGETVEVHALKKSDGTYYNASGFQVISVGEDGEQDDPEEGDTGDDIVNFKREGD